MRKFSIKKPNFIANVSNFLPVWLFSRSEAIWVIFQFRGCERYNKILRLETKFSGDTNLSQIFLDKMIPRSQFHITINWQSLNFHLNPSSTQKQSWERPQAVILQENSFPKVRFHTTVATASTVDNELSLTGVADCSFLNRTETQV